MSTVILIATIVGLVETGPGMCRVDMMLHPTNHITTTEIPCEYVVSGDHKAKFLGL